jgi:hypothetical protein
MASKNENTAVLLAWSKMVPISQAQDPLGLSLRVSARLSSELLHCITSITPRARYFSFLPWCVSDFAKREKTSQADIELIEAVRLREKALTLGCVLHHNGDACKDGRLVGSEKAIEWLAANPDRTPKFSQLSFVKNPALDAYYNSLVHLGFFHETPDENEVKEEAEMEDGSGQEITDLELSALGNRVASSYERAIGHLSVVAKLTREPDGCKPGELKKWGEFGGLCEVADSSAPDRSLLREIFFDRVGSPGQSHKFRHDSLTLFLELIDKISPLGIRLDHFVLRDAVYFNATSTDDDGNEILNLELSRPLEDIANRWRMFYFHYFLSVALESLFAGVVGYAQKAGMSGTRLETIVDSLKSKSVLKFMCEVLGGGTEGNFLEMTPRQLFQAGGFKSVGEDLGAGGDFDRHFNYSHPLSENNLAGQLRSDDLAYASPEGIACALMLLTMTVSRYKKWDEGQYGNWLAGATHDPYRDITVPVVLRELRESSVNFLDTTWREIAMLVIGRFVVRQHEVLSYEKVWDGTRALFHSEQGVIRWRGLSYDDIVVENSRFYSAVQILEDLALVEHDDNDRWLAKLTAEGKIFLKGELARMEKK